MSVEIGGCAKQFNLSEALALFPLVKSLTTRHEDELRPIQMRLNRMLSNDPRRSYVEKDYEQVVERWRAKILRLGLRVGGLWIVEFDVGNGFLCWRSPELGLSYYRAAQDAFSGRVEIHHYVDEHDPDWAY